MARQITGWHVLGLFVFAFGIIIAVNLTLAYKAVKTFPGLEVKNSYVASQSFDADRTAQLALGWDVAATVEAGNLRLSILKDGMPVEPQIEKAVFGRATAQRDDQTPNLVWTGTDFVAPVVVDGGNWDLWLEMRAEDGTLFKQRLEVVVAQ